MKMPVPKMIVFSGSRFDLAHAIDACVVGCDIRTTNPDDEPGGLARGVCVWQPEPASKTLSSYREVYRDDGKWLRGCMALWEGPRSSSNLSCSAPTVCLLEASRRAADAVKEHNLQQLAEAINWVHSAQLARGMPPVPSALRALAYKYVGGDSGYVLYLFRNSTHRAAFLDKPDTVAIEPYSV